MKPVFVTYVNFVLSKKEHYTLDYGTIRQELAGYPSVNLATLRRVIIDIRESKLPTRKCWVMREFLYESHRAPCAV